MEPVVFLYILSGAFADSMSDPLYDKINQGEEAHGIQHIFI